jgi:hypothetical protein
MKAGNRFPSAASSVQPSYGPSDGYAVLRMTTLKNNRIYLLNGSSEMDCVAQITTTEILSCRNSRAVHLCLSRVLHSLSGLYEVTSLDVAGRKYLRCKQGIGSRRLPVLFKLRTVPRTATPSSG